MDARVKPAHDERMVLVTAPALQRTVEETLRGVRGTRSSQQPPAFRINNDAKLGGARSFGFEDLARVIRISTIFVAICMVLVAASLGLVLYSVAGISATESAIVALTALTFLILYNAVSMRLRDRTDVGGQTP